MKGVLHIKTTVLPGQRIEVAVPELQEGASVDVFLVVSKTTADAQLSALEIIHDLKGHRLFQSIEEIDRHIREERDAWDE